MLWREATIVEDSINEHLSVRRAIKQDSRCVLPMEIDKRCVLVAGCTETKRREAGLGMHSSGTISQRQISLLSIVERPVVDDRSE